MIVRMGQEHERALSDLQRDRDEWRDQAKRLALGAPERPHAVLVALATHDGVRARYGPTSLDEMRAVADLDRCRHRFDHGCGGGSAKLPILAAPWRWLRTTGQP
jgi:hypothetical protein